MGPSVAPRAIACIIIHRKNNGPLGALVQAIQSGYVLPTELEAVHIRIQADAIRIVALGQGDEALLETPFDEHLVGRDAVLLSDAHQCGVVCLLVAHDGAVGLNDDIVVLAILDDVSLLAPRVKLLVVGIAYILRQLCLV